MPQKTRNELIAELNALQSTLRLTKETLDQERTQRRAERTKVTEMFDAILQAAGVRNDFHSGMTPNVGGFGELSARPKKFDVEASREKRLDDLFERVVKAESCLNAMVTMTLYLKAKLDQR